MVIYRTPACGGGDVRSMGFCRSCIFVVLLGTEDSLLTESSFWLLALGFVAHWTGAHKMRPYRIGRCA